MKLLRLKHVIDRAGLSRATIYRLQQLGTFPQRRRISLHAVGGVESEVAAWIAARPAIPSFYGGATSPLAVETPLTRRAQARAAAEHAQGWARTQPR